MNRRLTFASALTFLGAAIFSTTTSAQEETNACANADVIDIADLVVESFDRLVDAPVTASAGDAASASPNAAGSTQVVDGAVKPKLLSLAADAGLSESGGVTTLAVTPFAWIAAVDPEVRTEQSKYADHELARRFGGKLSFGGKGEEFDRDGDGEVDEALDAKNEGDIVTYEVSWRFLGTTDRRDRSNLELWDDMVARKVDDDPSVNEAEAAERIARRKVTKEYNRVTLEASTPEHELDPDNNSGDCVIVRRHLAVDDAYLAAVEDLKLAQDAYARAIDKVAGAWVRRVDGQLVMSLVASGTERESEYGGDKQSFGLRANRGFSTPGSSFSFQLDYLKNELPSGLDELEGFKLGLEYKQLLPGLAESLGWHDPTFSFGIAAERYSDVPADAHDTIAVASAKLSIGAGDNIRIPISLKWANRTDLLADEDDVIAHIGISYDFDAFTGGKKK